MAAVSLAGCNERENPETSRFFAAADEAEKLITPALTTHCLAELRKLSYFTFEQKGDFRFSAKAASMTERQIIVDPSPQDLVVMVAPVAYETKAILSARRLGQAGCSYNLRDGELVFRKALSPDTFEKQHYIMLR